MTGYASKQELQMAIVGHGIDLVEAPRIAEMLERHGERFVRRCFTEAEREHAEGRKSAAQHLAARFAAKEAVFKALGTGLANGATWQDVEVVNDAAGAPSVRISGVTGEIARARGAGRWTLSISHTARYAIASVIAESVDE